MIPTFHLLILSGLLFSLGLVIAIVKRHAILVLMGIELIFNAANLNLVAFSRISPDLLQGQVFVLFTIVIAAAEAAVALAIVQKAYQAFRTSDISSIHNLNG